MEDSVTYSIHSSRCYFCKRLYYEKLTPTNVYDSDNFAENNTTSLT